jgi:hypothetical protein
LPSGLPLAVGNRYPDLSFASVRKCAASTSGTSISRTAFGVLGDCSCPFHRVERTRMTRQSGDRFSVFSASASPILNPLPASKANKIEYRGVVLSSTSVSSASVIVCRHCSSRRRKRQGTVMRSPLGFCILFPCWVAHLAERLVHVPQVFTSPKPFEFVRYRTARIPCHFSTL